MNNKSKEKLNNRRDDMSMKKIQKNESNGITLIALVVTILVLLILAGISISIVLGEGGIIDAARRAGEATNAAIANEQQMLQNVVDWANNVINGNGGSGSTNPGGDTPLPPPPEMQKGEIEIIANPSTPTKNNVSVTIVDNKNTGYTIQWTKTPLEESSYKTYEEAIQVDKKTTIYARLKDEETGQTGSDAYKEIENIDKNNPKEFTPTTESTVDSITIKGHTTDEEADEEYSSSGIDKYYFSKDGTNWLPEKGIEPNGDEDVSYTFDDGLEPNTQYNFKMKAVDKATNERIVDVTGKTAAQLVTGITLSETNVTLKEGETKEITATISPNNASNKSVTWSSSVAGIVTIENDDTLTITVKAEKEGTTKIKATAKDGSDVNSNECTVTVKKPTVGDITGQKIEGQNKETTDDYGNKIVIPVGFKVLPNNTENSYTSKVEYKYSGDGRPQVQDGIVVQDEEGNQFVWIPVGTIKNKVGADTLIELKRRVFGDDGAVTLESADGTSFYSNTYLEEAKTTNGLSTKGNAIAKDIENGFKAGVKSKGGYYIARYEASYGGPNKPLSKVSTGTSTNAPTTVGILWNKITQINASKASQNMYTNKPYTSDLVNSYAWDTAIYFIQKYSGKATYSQEKAINYGNNELMNTGTNGDKVCNIYDMAGNCREFTTETCAVLSGGYSFPCVIRGGMCDTSYDKTWHRNVCMPGDTNYKISFRVVLYM